MKIQAQAHNATINGDIYSVAGGLLALKSPKTLNLHAENGNSLSIRFDSYVNRTEIHLYSDENYSPIIAVYYETFSEIVDMTLNALTGKDIDDFSGVLQSLSTACFELENSLDDEIA